MFTCIYCKKTTDNRKHSCRTLRGQLQLEPFKELLMQWFKVERRPIYHVEQNSPEWAGTYIVGNKLRTWCALHGIKCPTIKESNNSLFSKEKYKNTCQQKYGVDNISQSNEIKAKKIAVNLDLYGVENPFQRPEVKEKSTQTLMRKYGVTSARHIPRKHENGTGRLSGPHKKISDLLIQMNISHENEKENLFPKSRSTNNRVYSPIVDIWLKEHNTVIEIYGDRWHANPQLYLAEDILPLWNGDLRADHIWDIDAKRIDHIKSFGVRVIILWELDIAKNFDTIKSQLYDLFVSGR